MFTTWTSGIGEASRHFHAMWPLLCKQTNGGIGYSDARQLEASIACNTQVAVQLRGYLSKFKTTYYRNFCLMLWTNANIQCRGMGIGERCIGKPNHQAIAVLVGWPIRIEKLYVCICYRRWRLTTVEIDIIMWRYSKYLSCLFSCSWKREDAIPNKSS